jgi:hypothetical protein
MMVKVIITFIATVGLQDLSTVNLEHHWFKWKEKSHGFGFLEDDSLPLQPSAWKD